MKLKKEYLILTVVMIALIAYLAFHRSNRANYKLPKLSTINAKHISKLEITKAGKSIILKKKDDTWYIEPKGYPADSEKVKNMLDVIDKLKLTALVSQSKNYVRYDLNADKKIHVKAWQGKSLDREFDIGKEAATFKHTFVRLANDPNVYHARGDFKRKFDRTADDLRDKTVLSYVQKDIRVIKIKRQKDIVTLSRKKVAAEAEEKKNKSEKSAVKTAKSSEIKTVWENADGKKVETVKIGRLLGFLNHLTCENYINNAKKADFKDPIYTVTLKDAQEYLLSIFAKKNKTDKNYPAVSSENDYPFALSDSQVNSIKSRLDEIIKVKEKSKNRRF